MPRNLRFWRNVALIGAAHVAVIVGLTRWSQASKTTVTQNVVWMNGGSGSGAAPSVPPPKPAKISMLPPEPKEKEEPDDAQPILATAKSEIQFPVAKPTVTPTPSPKSTPKPTATPVRTPTPKIKLPPKSTPKPKPKPTASPARTPSPKKLVIAKASSTPRPTPEKKEEKEEVEPTKETEKKVEEKPVAASSDANKGPSSGNGGHAGGGGGQSQFGWYGSMLHDRFYSEWAQPANVASSGAKNSVLVKLRIEKDGRVSNFEIVSPSGNPAIDDSVRAAAKRVTQVEPLPAGLGNGEHYDVKVKFELNSE